MAPGHCLWCHLAPPPRDACSRPRDSLCPDAPPSGNAALEHSEDSCRAPGRPQRQRTRADVTWDISPAAGPFSPRPYKELPSPWVQTGSGNGDVSSHIWPEARADRANATILKHVGCYFCEIVCLWSYIPRLIADTIKFESQNILSQNWSGGDYVTPCQAPAVGRSWAASASGDCVANMGHVSSPPGPCSRRKRGGLGL